MHKIEPQHTPASTHLDTIRRVCSMIPPLWDLANYVAVNPFLGFSSRSVPEAARAIGDGLGARVLPDLAFYQRRWREGAFSSADLARAAQRSGYDAAALTALLDGTTTMPLRAGNRARTFAEEHDARHSSDWNAITLRQVALWCAAYTQADGTGWGRATTAAGLYGAWREAAQTDRALEAEGLPGWRVWAADLPATATTTITTLLDQLVAPDEHEAYLYRLLAGVYGWASFLRRDEWATGGELGAVADLLAIRIATDAAVAQLAPHATRHVHSVANTVEDEATRFVLQDALENGYAAQLFGMLAPPSAPATRPAMQAIFCIDVRSEPLRRQLEAQSPAIETRGFAGFFGVSLDWQAAGAHSARCPVLLQPAVHVQSLAHVTIRPGSGMVKHMQTAPAAAFSFVEIAGLTYGARLIADALGLSTTPDTGESHAPFTLEADAHGSGIVLADRIALAAAILKNTGLRGSCARLVLLCGHAGRSENNAHAASLDCGACGGHGGAINARIAAAVLNDQAVRAGLSALGLPIPADTWFIPGVHDTSVDQVTLLDTAQAPTSHRANLDQLADWLAQAGAQVRAERAPALGLAAMPDFQLKRRLAQRARDWSEARPEWGLARNAAFIAARRARTRGVNLHGRAFLHEYDWRDDADGSVLGLILSAPMVVASWINLQYFASTVDNQFFGCGTKALHNRVGVHGVVLGNGGDLRTGLALQSVQHADGSWYHEPLRLQVVVEAPCEQIDAVLDAQPGVKELVENGWLRLFALDPASTNVRQRHAGEWLLLAAD